MDRDRFLKRMGFDGDLPIPSLGSLSQLQRTHLLNVPFENLDIYWGREITLDLERFYLKIIENGRGGFCYELNGNFNELLKSIGFETRVVAAGVNIPERGFSPDGDHLAIVVGIEGVEYLADVGFGNFAAEPLRMEIGLEQQDPNGVFRIVEQDSDYLAVEKKGDDRWKGEYRFVNRDRDLEEFAEMCVHNQTSPDSHFTHGALCSLMLEGGRKTLTDKKFIVTAGGEKTESDIGSEEEFEGILEREFEIVRDISPQRHKEH